MTPPGAGPTPSVEPVPPQATDVFGPALDRAQRYAELLCTVGVVRGLIGPREPSRIWTRHLLNSAALAPLVPPGATVVDLGSGAGLPGVPLALARADLTVTLLEPMLRRVRFLEEVRDALALPVGVVRGRAEEPPVRGFDVVVARAVAPLNRLLTLALPLVRPGGVVLALKGAEAAVEVAAAAADARAVGITDLSSHVVGTEGGETVVVRALVAAKPLPLGGPTGESSRSRGRDGRRVR